MTLDDGLWKLWRDEADFSPLDFDQRFTGTISTDGQGIDGAWEICRDGESWRHDFDLRYRKQSSIQHPQRVQTFGDSLRKTTGSSAT